MDREDLLFIQEQIGYNFRNEMLLQQAFVRRSYSHEHPEFENNEVLEFIGDRALEFIIVRALADYYGGCTDEGEYSSEVQEGKLTETKRRLVERKMLASRISQLGFQNYLVMGKGDCRNNVQEDSHVKEDLFEAIVGAVALDSGWNVEDLDNVIGMMLDYEYYLNNGFSDNNNFIAIIQQWCQKEHLNIPVYKFAESHQNGKKGLLCTMAAVNNGDERFVCRLQLEGVKQEFRGRGDSKSEARMNAAQNAYIYLQENNMLYTMRDEIGEPVPERAINQLQELAQKGYISMPHYEFEENHDEKGNPVWTCECWVDEMDRSFTNISSSKKDCKRKCAYEMLLLVLEQEFE